MNPSPKQLHEEKMRLNGIVHARRNAPKWRCATRKHAKNATKQFFGKDAKHVRCVVEAGMETVYNRPSYQMPLYNIRNK